MIERSRAGRREENWFWHAFEQTQIDCRASLTAPCWETGDPRPIYLRTCRRQIDFVIRIARQNKRHSRNFNQK